MTSALIQDDYGGFDATFIGVTLRLWPKSWNLFQKISLRGRDPGEVVHLGNAALQGDAGEAFEVFATGTVMLHEWRHFHDFLLSPFGNHILRLRVAAAINGFGVIGDFTRSKAVIPVPVPKWRRMARYDQLALLDLWTELLGSTPKELDLALTGTSRLALEQTEKAYAAITNLVTAPQNEMGIQFHPYHVMEVSAIAVQANNVFTVFGTEHAQLFVNQLLGNPAAADYCMILRRWHSLCNHLGRPADYALLSIATTWSLLGDYTKEGWSACPTVRFAKLFELFATDGMPDFDEPAARLLENWSERLGSVSVFDSLQEAGRANLKLLAKLIDLPSDVKDGLMPIISAFESFADMQARMARMFRENPDFYTRPHLYAEHADQWMAAPIRLEFPYLSLVGEKEELEHKLNVRSAREATDGRIAVRRALLPGKTMGQDVISDIVAADASDLLAMVDFFFAEFRRDEPDFDIVRQVVSGRGMQAMEILA